MNEYNKTRLKAIETEIILQSVNSRCDLEDSKFVHDILKHLMETYEFDFEGWTDEIEREIIAENKEIATHDDVKETIADMKEDEWKWN